MQTRPLGQTGLHLPVLSFGASSLGAEFRSVKLDEALDRVRVALDCLNLLKANESIVLRQVTENLYERHMRPLFVG